MTICDHCGKVLTDKRGRRKRSANFDSAIPHRHANDYKNHVIYALCDDCYVKERQYDGDGDHY